MTEEEIKAIQDENTKLKEEKDALAKENSEFKTTNESLVKDAEAKDETIKSLTENAKAQGLNFKKLRDMTDKEKELLTEKEMELLQRQEKLEQDRETDQKSRLEFEKKQRDAVIDNLVKKYSKGDEEIAKQIRINLGKLNPELVNPAITEAELDPHIKTSFNMLGIKDSPDAIRDANNQDGKPAETNKDNNFADTGEGKDLMNKLGLTPAPVENNNNNNNNQ